MCVTYLIYRADGMEQWAAKCVLWWRGCIPPPPYDESWLNNACSLIHSYTRGVSAVQRRRMYPVLFAFMSNTTIIFSVINSHTLWFASPARAQEMPEVLYNGEECTVIFHYQRLPGFTHVNTHI